jgi:hypothetical protein
MTCAIVGCESDNGVPMLLDGVGDEGRNGFLPVCRRHERIVKAGAWTLAPSRREIILSDTPTVTAMHNGAPLFVLEDVGSVGNTSDRLPGTDQPAMRLVLNGYWPGHDLPEIFEVMVTRESVELLREFLPRPDGPLI